MGDEKERWMGKTTVLSKENRSDVGKERMKELLRVTSWDEMREIWWGQQRETPMEDAKG
jgi:predicted thioredoxin/glutaredoxin